MIDTLKYNRPCNFCKNKVCLFFEIANYLTIYTMIILLPIGGIILYFYLILFLSSFLSDYLISHLRDL